MPICLFSVGLPGFFYGAKTNFARHRIDGIGRHVLFCNATLFLDRITRSRAGCLDGTGLFNERLLGLVLGGILVLLIGHNHAWASARLHFYARPRLGILLHRIARWKWLAAVRQTRGEF